MEFRMVENIVTFDMENLLKVFRNEIPVYIIRKMIDLDICHRIRGEFNDVIKESHGGNRIDVLVPVYQIGATQYTKSSKDYFDECEGTRHNVNRILMSVKEDSGADFLLENFLEYEFSKRNIIFRPSTYLDQKVNMFTIRQWRNANNSNLSLLPHEDFSQLRLAGEDGYEIADVKRVVASNLCVSNNIGGELMIWNYEPTMELKRSLGVEYSGYPYPLELLSESESITVDINPGDIYFINANLIHAVKELRGSERISAGRFMGFVSDDTVVYWT